MAEVELGTVIAQREVTSVAGDGTLGTVKVLIGAPKESIPSQEWYCPIQIIGVGTGQVRAIYGVDSVQALQLAIETVNAILTSTGIAGLPIRREDASPRRG